MDCSHAGRDWLECDGVMRGTLVRVVNEDLSRYAKRVCCPVVIVNGDSDTATPLVHAKKLCRLIPHASLVTIVGGHFAFFRTPQAFARTVECMGE